MRNLRVFRHFKRNFITLGISIHNIDDNAWTVRILGGRKLSMEGSRIMTTLDAVLLVVRAVLGVTFLLHGGQKLFGWYGGGGTRGTQEMMGMLGVGHPRLMGWMATLSEFLGGLLVLIGLFTQLAAAIIIST